MTICAECLEGVHAHCCGEGCDCICQVEEPDFDWIDDYEPEACPSCGKEYEDFSDYGCATCDTRVA